MTEHDHDHGKGHGHSHPGIDPSIASSDRGIWAVKWSFVGLFMTAGIQLAVVIFSNSISLLADTIHNFGDAATAIPLAIAFLFAKRKASPRFTYGYGRVEDFAGIVVVLMILTSAVVAAYEAIHRLMHPERVGHLGAVAIAAVIGFLGNEGVAIFRIRVGKEIGSAALIADGYHARTDGWTSLAVLFGALGVWLGFPLTDPIIGILITAAILVVVWRSAKEVVSRALDGVDPNVLSQVQHAAAHVAGVREVKEVRARWLGPRRGEHHGRSLADRGGGTRHRHRRSSPTDGASAVPGARGRACRSRRCIRRGTSRRGGGGSRLTPARVWAELARVVHRCPSLSFTAICLTLRLNRCRRPRQQGTF
jgi:cation diffusion facilitator family transporter